jgi:hypothetical protein
MTSKRRSSIKKEIGAPTEETSRLPSHPPPLMPTQAPSLAQIRSQALNVQADAAHTIAELEAWRAEIDCTIAFLKAQRR